MSCCTNDFPPKPPTAALEHRSSQPIAVLPVYQQAPVPIPALTPLSPSCGVTAAEASATSLSTAFPTTSHRISSYLFCLTCIVCQCLPLPPLSPSVISYGLLKLPIYFCFSLSSPLQTFSPAKNGDGVLAPVRFVCGYIGCLVSSGLNQNTRTLLYWSKILYYSKTT